MRYYGRTIIGLGLLSASLTAFCYSLYQLLGVGTCASGGAYVSARECPTGVGGLIVTLVVSVFAGLIGTGIWGSRGNPPDDPDRPGGSAISSGVVAWSGLFLGGGLTCLYAVLGPDADPGPGAETGAIIVAAIFIPMGAIPLIGAIGSGVGKVRRRRDSGGLAGGGTPSAWSDSTTATPTQAAMTPSASSTSSVAASVFGTEESTPSFSDGGSAGGLGSSGIASVGQAVSPSSSSSPPAPTAPFGWTQGTAPAAPTGAGSTSDPSARLEKLAALRASGVLTDAEFQAAKTKILGEL